MRHMTISNSFVGPDGEFIALKLPPQSPDLYRAGQLWVWLTGDSHLRHAGENPQQLCDDVMSIWTKTNILSTLLNL